MDIRKHWKPPTRSAPAEALIRPPQPPLIVKVRVAMRQVNRNAHRREHIISLRAAATGGLGKLFEELKIELSAKLGCAWKDIRLDHNPALALREYDSKTGKYTPDANDPYFLRYITDPDHHIKTHVRGDGAQRSDTSERMHRRRLDENRGLRPKKPSRKIESRGFDTGPRVDRKWWGSRAFAKGRKMQSRGWR